MICIVQDVIWVIKLRRVSWKKRSVCRRVLGKPEEERLLGRSHCMWEDNIKIDFKEAGWWAVHKVRYLRFL
jgi:hypothetical protein